jgi:hypothetical protein
VTLDQAPLAEDLEIPVIEMPALRSALEELALSPTTDPLVAANQIMVWFQQKFHYTLQLVRPSDRASALQDFLLTVRSGHCEYFASAMTLLLRQLGIPARYAVGFSVHEFSPLEGQYIVRGRHAHAWTIAYIHDRWIFLDPTPSDWRGAEEEKSLWNTIGDWASWFQFTLGQNFQALQKSETFNRWWWVILVPIVGIYLWQMRKRRRVMANPIREVATVDLRSDQFSFYEIMARLEAKGWVREPAETLKQWLHRLQQDFPEAEDWQTLNLALEQHYRDRFNIDNLQIRI